MTHQKKILHIDDVDIDRKPLAELLIAAGYQIFEASTIEAAEQILADVPIHMMIVDLNMKGDENDDDDRSGLGLVENPAYFSIPKVILTGYADDPQSVRKALDPSQDRKVVDFVGKLDGEVDQTLIKAFENNVRLNWELEIQWTSPALSSLAILAGLITPRKERISFAHRMDELEDLLRQLFVDSHRLIISRLLTCTDAVAWIEVSTESDNGVQNHCILACGQKDAIQNEANSYNRFIPQSTNAGSVRIVEQIETIRFAAATFECLGGNIAEMVSLQELYLRRPIREIQQSIAHLFDSTLSSWHGNRSAQEIPTLEDLYETWASLHELDLQEDGWSVKLQSLCDEVSSIRSLSTISRLDETLNLYLSEGESLSYTDPIHFLLETGAVLNRSFTVGTVHGRLYLDKLWIDPFQQTVWLIDFSKVREGPILFDYVALESALKIELLTIVNIGEWCEIEEALINAPNLEETISLGKKASPEAEKVLQIIGTIRRHAAMATNRDTRCYRAALFVYAITQLAQYDEAQIYIGRDLMPFVGHWISAAIICQHLKSPRQFEINYEDESVLVEGMKKTDLTKQEWQLLSFMDKRIGQLSTFEGILKEVYKDASDDIDNGAWMKDSGKPKVIAAIRRMRNKLEPNSRHPRYIVTERERGYRLEK